MKTTEIEFSSQSKSVVSKVNLVSDDTPPEQLLEEAKKLFNDAERYALNKTFERNK